LDTSVEAAMQASNQAIVTMDDALIVFLRTRIIELAMRHKVPVMGELRPMAATGGLMSYGPNQIEMWRHAAGSTDKILRGANPADLPVQQPTKFELVVNLNSAKALGLTIPYQILALGDEVIE